MVCMDIATVPNRTSPPAMLLRESCRDGATVRPRPLATLTSWAPERSAARRRTLKGACDGLCGDLAPTCGPICAVLCVLQQRADRLGLTRVLGQERLAQRALFLVLARGAAPGSRLAAVRWADQHAGAETLGLSRGDADDLSQALAALAPRQDPSEAAVSRGALPTMERAPTVG